MKLLQNAVTIVMELGALLILVWAALHFYIGNPGVVVCGLLALASLPLSYPLGILFMGLPFLMTIAVLYGVSACVLATVPYAAIGTAFLKNSTVRRKCFIFAFLVCNAFLYGHVYRLVNPDHSFEAGNIILGVTVMTVIAFAFSFLAREKEQWKEHLYLTNTFILAGTYTAIAASLAPMHSYVPLGLLPIVAMSWGWSRLIKVQQKERQQWLELLAKLQIPIPEDPNFNPQSNKTDPF